MPFLPTGQGPLTQDGTILGTLQYMAPEQVEGKIDDIDARTDIFAFGAVVYEMATGKKCFEGQSAASTIAKILEHNPPPMSSLQPMTPPALDRVVKTCLAKSPEDRWQTARDLHRELTWIKEGGSQADPPAPGPARKRRERMAWLTLTGLLALTSAVLAVMYSAREGADVRAVQFEVLVPNQPTTPPPVPVLSPDGKQLAAITASRGGRIAVQYAAWLTQEEVRTQ